MYDALSRKRVSKTIITADRFVKVGGYWMLLAAHGAAVTAEEAEHDEKEHRRGY